jgi:hypothetical protein
VQLVARTLIELIWAILLSFKGAISLLLVKLSISPFFSLYLFCSLATEEKQVALTKLQNKYNEKKGEIDNLTSSSDIAPLKESSIDITTTS